MKPGQFDNPQKTELTLKQEVEAAISLQLQQLSQSMDREQALGVYAEIKKLAAEEFKSSKMVDTNGELMIMWHGSPRKFDEFKTDAAGEYRWRNEGVHFSSSRELIEQYADKAYSAVRTILANIAQESHPDVAIQGEVLAEAKRSYNEIVQDLITNGEESKYYKKGYGVGRQQQKVRKKDLDAIVYGKQQFGTEWALEIFNGEMPTARNSNFDEQNGIWLGNGIGKYEYATVLNIQDPYTTEATDIDQAFEAGEKAHKEQNKDGAILFHKEPVVGMGGLTVEQSKGTFSAAVFDPTKIKILGRREGGKFVAMPDKKNNKTIESNLEFPNIEITPEKPFEFSMNLQKKPIDIKDGDTLGGNYTEVKFEGKLKDLMRQASDLQILPERERILKLIELVRANLIYPYSEIINELKQSKPDLGQWLAARFGDEATIIMGVSVNDCLDKGYGNCKIMAATFLALAQAAGLKGIFGQNGEDKVNNLVRPDTGKPMFKMGKLGEPVTFSHAWAEVQLQDGSWVPVDLTANMAATTPEMLEFFEKANYKTQVPVIFEGLPKELDRNPPAVKFEPGQAAGKFDMNIGIRRIATMSRAGGSSKPVTDKFKGEIKLSLADSSESKAANLIFI